MSAGQVPAVEVMYAAHFVFSQAGDERHAERKVNTFIRRCGADIEKPKEQPLELSTVKDVAFAMLDRDSEKLFWTNLKK